MAYYSNLDDPSFYPVPGESEGHPFLYEPSAIDWFHDQAHNTLGGHWGTVPQQGSLFDSPTSLPGETNFGKHNYSHLID